MKPSISVIIPALNEEGNIAATVNEVLKAIDQRFQDYELLVFNDGSSDKTGEIADELTAKNGHLKVIHNSETMGLGYNYRKGVEIAKNDFVVMIPGDNEISGSSIEEMFKLVGTADIIIPYTVNTWVRPISRRIISRIFVMLMNLLFGLRLRYYNGPCIHKREIIQPMNINTSGFAYMAAILVRLLKSGHSFREVGMYLKEREYGSSKAFALKNIASVIKTVISLFWEVMVKRVRA